MKEFLIKIMIDSAIALLKSLMPSLIREAKELIQAAFDFDMSGAEKMAKVVESLKEIGGEVGEELSEMSGSLLNLVLELLVTDAKIERGDSVITEG